MVATRSMSEHGGCGQADLPRLPRALMIISLDFEQLSARLFAAAHARIWPISIVRVFLKLNDGDDDDDDDDDDDEDGI